MTTIKTTLNRNERFKKQLRLGENAVSSKKQMTELAAQERMIFAKTLARCMIITVLAIILLPLLSTLGLVDTTQPLIFFPVLSALLIVIWFCIKAILKMLD